MTKIRKKSSKRVSLRKKYTVEKKVKEHKRKIKKESRKLTKQGLTPKRSSKQMGIPNLFPFKEEMLDAMERKETLDKQKQEEIRILRQAKQHIPEGNLESFAQEIKRKVESFEQEKKFDGLTKEQIEEAQQLMDPNSSAVGQSRRAYYKELRKVMEAADVIIEVLDARDPQGCRSEEIEQLALKEGKKVLLVLNKIDLVPPQNARMWQRYFRREFATVLFKATQQSQNSNLAMGTTLHKKSAMDKPELVEKMTSSSKAVGTENLMNILKNYARVEGQAKTKQLITVGIVGFPNVGKSSLINSLKRSKAAATGNTPGLTKSMQEVSLDKNIVLIDSPGVVLASKEQSDSLILRSAMKVEDVTDPTRPVEALLGRIQKEEILKFYRIADFETTQQFLGQVARKRGFLQNKGVPNFDMTARSVIRDYLNGKLKFFTAPPITEDELSDEEMDEEMN